MVGVSLCCHVHDVRSSIDDLLILTTIYDNRRLRAVFSIQFIAESPLSPLVVIYYLRLGDTHIIGAQIPMTTMTHLYFRPLSLLLLLSSASVSYARPPPPYEEHCPAILSTAIEYDTDSSGGLNPTEFANFWSDLIDSGSAIEQPQQVREDASAPRATTGDNTDSSKQIYTILLCQCHYTFHHNLRCCDDTATDDDDDTPTELAMRDDDPMEIWTEVSLEGFAEMRWGEEVVAETEAELDMAKYSKEFCQEVIWALEKEGIELGEDFASGLNVTIDAGNSTEVEVVVIGEDENATSTTMDASETTTVVPEVDGTGANATTTSATTTNTTASTTTTTTTVAETTSATTAAPALEAFDVTFIGSTNGKLNAASNDFEDVTVAFWTVSLDILEDMTTATRRRMQWDFGAKAAIYFEGVVMDITDIGKRCLVFCLLPSIRLLPPQHCGFLLFAFNCSTTFPTRMPKWIRIWRGRITLSSIHKYAHPSRWRTTKFT